MSPEREIPKPPSVDYKVGLYSRIQADPQHGARVIESLLMDRDLNGILPFVQDIIAALTAERDQLKAKIEDLHRKYVDNLNGIQIERDQLRDALAQVDDEMCLDFIAAKDGDYKTALRKWLEYNIMLSNNPQVSEEAKAKQDELQGLRDALAEQEASFELRWKADMRAIARWREAGPDRELRQPDHADLCVWLMDQLDSPNYGLRNQYITAERDQLREQVSEVSQAWQDELQDLREKLEQAERDRNAVVILLRASHTDAQWAAFPDRLQDAVEEKYGALRDINQRQAERIDLLQRSLLDVIGESQDRGDGLAAATKALGRIVDDRDWSLKLHVLPLNEFEMKQIASDALSAPAIARERERREKLEAEHVAMRKALEEFAEDANWYLSQIPEQDGNCWTWISDTPLNPGEYSRKVLAALEPK